MTNSKMRTRTESVKTGNTIVNLNYLKKGEYFSLKDLSEPAESQVWVRGDYDRTDNTYSCCKFSDMNVERFFKGDIQVYIGFTF